MPLDETILNGRLAHHIRDLTGGLGWDVREESRGSFEEAGAKRPDVVIRRANASPLVIENEYRPGATLEDECVGRLGYTIAKSGYHPKGEVSVVFAVRSPVELRDCVHSGQADTLLRNGIELEYAVYSPKNGGWARFPNHGFIQGDVRALVEFMKPASLPQNQVDRAADTLAVAATNTAAVLVRDAQHAGFGGRIGKMLRQPWPDFTEFPSSRKAVRQFRADEQARTQTATMCAVILINALAYQQDLSCYHDEIDDIAVVLGKNKLSQLTKRVVLKEWSRILGINYWPIFHIAHLLLSELPTNTARHILDPMVDAADEIGIAMSQHDVAGTVFQRLIADRKTLKTYYTLPASTVLVANLGIHDDRDWSDPEMVKNYRIADYACGTGGLVMAAYRRVRDLHRTHGGSPEALHPYMMENSITSADIMPAAVHLTSSLLSSAVPNMQFKGTRNILYPFGGRQKRDAEGNGVVNGNGDPEHEADGNGSIAVDIGSLELLGLDSARMQSVLPISDQQAMGAKGEIKPIEVEIAPASDDLVIMNPPFTRSTFHAPRDATDHVDPNNPAFAAFGTTVAEQKAMASRLKKLGANSISDGNAGLASSFAAIAHNMVRPGGRIALILPTSAMMGGSFDASSGRANSWQKLRNLLQSSYDQVVVVSVNRPAKRDSAFSADSDFADCIVIARKTDHSAPDEQAHFVNLHSRPRSTLEAQETARAIRQAVRKTTRVGDRCEILIGAESIGFVVLEASPANAKWTAVRIADPTLHERARALCIGNLSLPQRADSISIPIAPAGQIGTVGPLDRDIAASARRGAFQIRPGSGPGSEFPMLWNHPRDIAAPGDYRQDRLLTTPDCHGEYIRDRRAEAYALWSDYATNLHVNRIFQFNANPTAACWTEQKSLGGSVWPTLKVDGADREKALCLWLNSTLGMLVFWIESNRTQDGRGITTVTAIRNLPVLNVRALAPDRLAAAVGIFDDLMSQPMLPANEAYRDPVRHELDRRLLTDVLGIDDAAAIDQLATLRSQWCAEPTVNGTKRTGIAYQR